MSGIRGPKITPAQERANNDQLRGPEISPAEKQANNDALRGPGTPQTGSGRTPLDIVRDLKRNPPPKDQIS